MTLIGISLFGFLLLALFGTTAGRAAGKVLLSIGLVICGIIVIAVVIAMSGPSAYAPSQSETFAPSQNEVVNKGASFMTSQEMYGSPSSACGGLLTAAKTSC